MNIKCSFTGQSNGNLQLFLFQVSLFSGAILKIVSKNAKQRNEKADEAKAVCFHVHTGFIEKRVIRGG